MSHISWDEYFMGVALLSSERSKDPHTKVGACIVNTRNRIVGIGYNGFPYGCNDTDYPWGNAQDAKFLDTKYPYVVHAEANAILNATQSLLDARIYVSLFPCNECAKLIIQSGIKEVVYMSDKYSGTDTNIASKRMLESAGVKVRQMNEISITLKKGE
ncbi:MAG: dCMP deaminase family protein [Acholeplasmatales bacterium]|nr:dCMP deaminase family protein [Acholeplasmatales bacterium]